MEQENQHPMIIVHDNEEQQEEVEDLSLKITFPHVKDNNNNVVTTVVVTSSSVSNGSNGHSNGASTIVTDLDEFSLQKDEELEKKRNVGECNSDKEQDCVPVGLGLVANFVGEAIKDDAIFGSESSDIFLQNKNSVFFDKQQGNEVNGLNRVQNGDATNHEESKLDQQVENSAIQTSLRGQVHGFNRVQIGDVTNQEETKLDEQVENSAFQNSLRSEVHTLHGVQNCDATNHDDNVPSSSELSSLHNSSDKQATPAVNSNEENGKELNSIEEIDHQEKEYDVELVIAKQETHDLYCPNCKSCITKRVILKKRKRNIQILDNKGKRDRLDSVVDNNVVNPDSTLHEANQGNYAKVTSEITSMDPLPAPVTAAAADDDGDDHPEKEVEVFRCLSCFSIFIPSGKGFNLFRNFGGASKDETSQNSSNIPSSSPNWFISLFTSNKRKTATEPGDTSQEYSTTDPADQNQSTITSPLLSSPDIGHPEGTLGDADLIKNVKPTSDVNHGRERMNSTISSNGVQSVVQDFIDFSEKEQSLTGKLRTDNRGKNKTSVDTTNTNTVEVTSSTNFSNGTVSEYKSVKSVTTTSSETFVNSGATAKGAILNHYQEKPEFIVPTSTTIASLIVEKLPKDVNQMPEIVKNNDYDFSLRQDGAQSPVQSFDSTSSAIDGIFPSKTDITLIDTVRKDINGKINPSVINENKADVIVVVHEEANESTTLQTEGNVPRDGAIVTESQTQVDIGEQPRNEVGEPKKWEIVKSIVYGGLVESITSLGIVSSAASSGATPLNIITLGFANLIGGLFILGHNLKELKDSHSRGQQLQTNVQDRYQELLGNRSNFVFHAVIAVFSFLIFGSVPLSRPDYPTTWIPYINSKDCSQGFCSMYCPQWCYIVYTPPPPPPFQYPDDDSKPYFSPLVIAILGVLATAFLLLTYYTLISKYCGHRESARRNTNDPVDEIQENRRENCQVSTFGLDDAQIKSIAVFSYKKGDAFFSTTVTDCSVCLSEFQDDESVRLLPMCNHVFHLPCIDTWLKSNSSCPLCRSSVFTSNASIHNVQVPATVIELPSRTETFSEEQIVMEEAMIHHSRVDSKAPSLRAFSDLCNLQGRERIIEIRDEVCESIGRSVSMDHSFQNGFSIGDVLNMNEDEDDSCEEGCSMDVSSSKISQGESSKSRYKRRVLHCVMSPIAMKRSFSNGRFSLGKIDRGKRQGILPV